MTRRIEGQVAWIGGGASGIGEGVAELFEHGRGAMAQVAVEQDASGEAWDRMMAVAKGIGATRGGVFESSLREEAELDLFAEQIVWSGLVAWFESCFELGVENGFAPELMVLELYASGEASEILGLMARNGFYKQMSHHSTTGQYGTLSRSRRLLTDEVRTRMRKLYARRHQGWGIRPGVDRGAGFGVGGVGEAAQRSPNRCDGSG